MPNQNNIKSKRPFVNTSGRGINAKVPAVVKTKFNWGACLLSWIWGFGNQTYITLINIILFFVPVVNIIVAIWFGRKGNEWAWQNKRFKDIKQFNENQKKWAIAGVIFYIILIPVTYFILSGGLDYLALKTKVDNSKISEKTSLPIENITEKINKTDEKNKTDESLKALSSYFKSYTIAEDENRFYISEEDWLNITSPEKKKLLNLAAQIAANKKKKEYKNTNSDANMIISQRSELLKTKLYSNNDKNKLLGRLYVNKSTKINNKSSNPHMQSGMIAYRFYNPNSNVKHPVKKKSSISKERLIFRKCYTALNKTIKLTYSLDKKYITNTSDFIKIFTNRMTVIPEKTTSDSFTTSDNNNYKIVPLRSSCNLSTNTSEIGQDSACARIIINNKYSLYLYPDGAFPANNSIEKKLLGS